MTHGAVRAHLPGIPPRPGEPGWPGTPPHPGLAAHTPPPAPARAVARLAGTGLARPAR